MPDTAAISQAAKLRRLHAAVTKTIKPLLADLSEPQQEAYLDAVCVDLYDEVSERNFTLAPLSRIVTIIQISRARYGLLPATNLLVPYYRLWLRLNETPQAFPEGGALLNPLLDPKYAADIRALILIPNREDLYRTALAMHLYGLAFTTARQETVQLSILRALFEPEWQPKI